MNVLRIVNGKLVSQQGVQGWMSMLVREGVIPLERIKQNKAAVQQFIEGLNRQDPTLLDEVSSPEVADTWTRALPGMYARMRDHHIELTDMIADGDVVAVKMATSGYHTGPLHGLPATGRWWTNRVFTYFHFVDGKIVEVDTLPDVENLIQQIGGVIRPLAR